MADLPDAALLAFALQKRFGCDVLVAVGRGTETPDGRLDCTTDNASSPKISDAMAESMIGGLVTGLISMVRDSGCTCAVCSARIARLEVCAAEIAKDGPVLNERPRIN